jgi:hypothetical protein
MTPSQRSRILQYSLDLILSSKIGKIPTKSHERFYGENLIDYVIGFLKMFEPSNYYEIIEKNPIQMHSAHRSYKAK